MKYMSLQLVIFITCTCTNTEHIQGSRSLLVGCDVSYTYIHVFIALLHSYLLMQLAKIASNMYIINSSNAQHR